LLVAESDDARLMSDLRPLGIISDGVGGIGAWPLFIRLPKSRPSRRASLRTKITHLSHLKAIVPLCRNILTIIPIATGHEVAARHFVETNSLVKCHQSQTLHRGAHGPAGAAIAAPFHSSRAFCQNELIYENIAKSKPHSFGSARRPKNPA
jgi:hypothetical protein